MTRPPPEPREPTPEHVARTRAAALRAWDELGLYAFDGVEISTVLAVCEAAARYFALQAKERAMQANEIELPAPAGFVNGDELDNMLDDRTATAQGTRSEWRRTGIYTATTVRRLIAEHVAAAVAAERARCAGICDAARNLNYTDWDSAQGAVRAVLTHLASVMRDATPPADAQAERGETCAEGGR